MKFLKYLLYFLLGFIVLFLAAGVLKPSVNYGHEIIVDKPLKEAWAVHKDKSKYDQWLEGFKSMELISGEQGEIGSQYRVVVKPDEEQPDFEMIETIVDKKKFDFIRLDFDSDMMFFEQTTSFSEIEGKTKVKTESKVSGKNVFMRSMFAWMELLGGSFQAQEEKNIEGLKRVIEGNTTVYNLEN